MKQIVFSGIQPSGMLTLGNYFGAISQWVTLQHTHQCLFSVVDLHAMTVFQDPKKLRQHIFTTTALLLACGVNPKIADVFLQSQNPDHTKLAWYLQCICRVGWLYRMTQFKDKALRIQRDSNEEEALLQSKEERIQSNQEQASVGLLTYPVLQAADILLYDTKIVPVGADQVQHIELTRDIAKVANYNYKCDLFVVPNVQVLEEAEKIMSLTDGSKKMSKSASQASYIGLLDESDVLVKKIKRAKTDSLLLPDSKEKLKGRWEAKNLLNILALVTHQSLDKVISIYAGKQFSVLKEDLQDAVVSFVDPIRIKSQNYLKDEGYLLQVLQEGLNRVQSRSSKKMQYIEYIMNGINKI